MKFAIILFLNVLKKVCMHCFRWAHRYAVLLLLDFNPLVYRDFLPRTGNSQAPRTLFCPLHIRVSLGD